ncbi:MAG TPA: DUF447 domain-containing protein [Gemmatimonadaceae bacterium]|nr:DUF447 domain-containing protein [Gemmatimonadaceae bacterium]
MIIETIVTSSDAEGKVNFAPMGVEWGEELIVIKPFLETTTFRNLSETGVAVVNITDDVRIFARAALSSPTFAAHPAKKVNGVVLDAACSWREVKVVNVDDTPPRSRIETRVVHSGSLRDFIGFNRARGAVLEATILATRTHMIPADEIRASLERLQVIVNKTAGEREHEAMNFVTAWVRDRLEEVPAMEGRER